MAFLRNRRQRGGKIVLSGFASQATYDDRVPDWEPDHEHDSLDEATATARSWVEATGPQSLVEVIELRGRTGRVVRVVTAGGVEDIIPDRFLG